MKIDKETIKALISPCQKVLDRLRETHPDIVATSELSDGMMHDLWFRVYASTAFEDTNPNVLRNADGTRVLEHNHDFPLYPCGTDDTTLTTALRRIKTELSEVRICKSQIDE